MQWRTEISSWFLIVWGGNERKSTLLRVIQLDQIQQQRDGLNTFLYISIVEQRLHKYSIVSRSAKEPTIKHLYIII